MKAVSQLAAEARVLLGNPTFQAVLEEIRQPAVQVFLNASSKPEAIAAAHDRVRAVQIILDALQTRLDAETIEQKGQHRAND